MENRGEWRKVRFARNLDTLIACYGLNRKQFAERVMVPYSWLHRAANEGITRLDHRGEGYLSRIAVACGWPRLKETLWDHDFRVPAPESTMEGRAERLAEELRRLAILLDEDDEPLASIIRQIRAVTKGSR